MKRCVRARSRIASNSSSVQLALELRRSRARRRSRLGGPTAGLDTAAGTGPAARPAPADLRRCPLRPHLIADELPVELLQPPLARRLPADAAYRRRSAEPPADSEISARRRNWSKVAHREMKDAHRPRRRPHEAQVLARRVEPEVAVATVADHPNHGSAGRPKSAPKIGGGGRRHLVRVAEHDHVGIGPVEELWLQAGASLAYDEPVCERPGIVGPADELRARADHGAVAVGNLREDLLQRPAGRPPEFVRVAVEDPVGRVLGRGEAGHLGGPADLVGQQLARLVPDHVGQARVGVASQDLGRAIDRAVVGDDEEVDAEGAVKPKVVLEDVVFVAHLERHHELHLVTTIARASSGTPATLG